MKAILFRLCALLIALFTVACGGSSDVPNPVNPGHSAGTGGQGVGGSSGSSGSGGTPYDGGSAGTAGSSDLDAGGDSQGTGGFTADSGSDSPSPMMCHPGNLYVCMCMGGVPSTQMCQSDAKSFGPCNCSAPSKDAGSDALPTQDSGPSEAGTDAAPLSTIDVALDPNTPPGKTLCAEVNEEPVFDFTLTSGPTDEWSKSVLIHHVGTGAVSEVSLLRLELSYVYFTGTLVDAVNGVWSFDTPGIFTAAGQSAKLRLHASFKGVGNTTHAFEIVAPSSLYTITPAIVTGSYPIRGNTFTLSTSPVCQQGVQLHVQFNGPAKGTALGGVQQQTMFKTSFTAPWHDLSVKKVPVTLTCTGGGMVRGSKGTPYFSNLELKGEYPNNNTAMGSLNMPSATQYGQSSVDLEFTGSWTLFSGTVQNLQIMMTIAGQEDAPGELFGHECYLTLHSLVGDKVFDNVTGHDLTATEVNPNADLTGNVFVIQQPDLVVGLSASPVSGTHMKKEQNVPSVGITFLQGAKDGTINQVTLTGQADRGAGFGNATARSEFAKSVSVLCLFDGPNQVGFCRVPDPVTGKTTFTNLGMSSAPHASRTLTVKASYSSSVGNPAGDKIAIGIEMGNDVVAIDNQLNAINAHLLPEIQWQPSSSSPLIVQTILNSGTASIVDDAHPASKIVVGNTGIWERFAGYKTKVQYEGGKFDRLSIMLESWPGGTCSSKDFVAVAVVVGGAFHGLDVFQAGQGMRDIDMSSDPIIVPQDGTVAFEMWAKMAAVRPTSDVSAAHSGDTCALTLNHDQLSGEWDQNYTGKINARITGSVTGERMYAPFGGYSAGNLMVLRKTKPTVTMLSVPTHQLTNGSDTETLKFQETADPAGTVYQKQYNMVVHKSSDLTLTNIRLKRGAFFLDPSLYEVSTVLMTTPVTDSNDFPAGNFGGSLSIHFVEGAAEIISPGLQNVYTVHAVVNGAVVGSYLSVALDDDSHGSAFPPATGYLFQDVYAKWFSIGHAPVNGADPLISNGNFAWSDMSEGATNPSSYYNGGSADWIDGKLVPGLNAANASNFSYN